MAFYIYYLNSHISEIPDLPVDTDKNSQGKVAKAENRKKEKFKPQAGYVPPLKSMAKEPPALITKR